MTIKSVGIIGSGIMGSGIAQVAATAGFDVVLRSRKQESADATVAAMEKALAKQVSKGRMEQADADAAVARVTATSKLDDLADCDLVIESVVEDLATKLAPLQRARPPLQGRRHPGDQHLDAVGDRHGRGDRAAPSGCAACTSSTRRR